MTKTFKCSGKHFSQMGLLAVTMIMGIAVVPAASAAPQDPNATVLAQECGEGTGTIVTLNPGLGKALWDVTAEVVSDRPSYLIKTIVQDVYVNGVHIGTFTFRFGNKVGLGDVFTCTFTEEFTTPDGDLVQIFGTSDKVRL